MCYFCKLQFLCLYLTTRIPFVLIGSGCYHKVPYIGWLLNNRKLFHTVLSEVSAWCGSAEGPLLDCGEQFLAVSLYGRKSTHSSSLCLFFSHKATSGPIHEATLPISSQHPIGVRASAYEFGGRGNGHTTHCAMWVGGNSSIKQT